LFNTHKSDSRQRFKHIHIICPVSIQVTLLALLEHLDMSFNRISQMPETFATLRELRFLNLANNRIVDIPNERIDVLANVQVQ